jgi:hypothetical protein
MRGMTRVALILLATLALPVFALPNAEEAVISAIRARLERFGGGDSSRIVFVKDASGRVTHYLYRESSATDRIVRKIK